MKKNRKAFFFGVMICSAMMLVSGCGYFNISQQERLTPIEDPSASELVKEEVFQFDYSLLEIDDEELLFLFDRFKQTREVEMLGNIEPFEMFQLYMYTQAGEDYETLYYFYPEGSLNVSKEQFIEEGRNEVTTQNNREFMKRFNEVREVIIRTNDESAQIHFTLEEERRDFTFQLNRIGESWFVVPVPLQ
ncbi:hypothetical protein N0O92_05675 [Alkalihalobacillus sp. MEB130]|uniref:hypothetical protein n=1 Tax=Alkalihalobacillus sp. MEB130 TaxID=2976704 RepID=UPI0028DF1B4C|nr:hypothetical protein [Alkalihalobacillus sp. MEB130]MDT8859716.1 hypothetical protein [Alkalihalobacillus sp. MEB130]